MSFLIHSTDDGRIPPIEYLPAGAITPKVGLALTQTAGNLAVAGGAVKPTYIAMTGKDSACAAGDIIPVIRVLPDMIFESTASVAMTSIKLGDRVTLSADGLQVTATTTGGVAEVIGLDDTAAGCVVRVRFSIKAV